MTNSDLQPAADPRAEYSQRLEAWQARQALCESQHRRIGTSQLALGGATLLVIGLALVAKVVSVLWVLAPLLAIVVLAVIHERVLKRRGRCSRTVTYYQRALVRLGNSWMGTGETGERFQSASHPYSRDLDLFGQGSLFELLCTARTRGGQETLAKWLLEPASPQEVRARQEALRDLRGRLDLREDLAVLAEDASSLAPAEDLAAWGEGESLLGSPFLRFSSAALAVLWLASVAVWMAWGVAYPALLASVVNVSFTLAYRRRVADVTSAVESAARDLALLAGVLARLEAEQFAAPKLVELRAALDSQGLPPSRWIARLNRRMEYLDSRHNLIVRSLDPFVLWTLQCAGAIEACESARVRRSAGGSPPSANSRPSRRWAAMPMSIPPTSFRNSPKLLPALKLRALPIPCCLIMTPCATTWAWAATCASSSSADRTWRGKVPWCGRWGSMPCWLSVALRCAPAGCASHRSPLERPSACSIRSRAESRDFMRKSAG